MATIKVKITTDTNDTSVELYAKGVATGTIYYVPHNTVGFLRKGGTTDAGDYFDIYQNNLAQQNNGVNIQRVKYDEMIIDGVTPVSAAAAVTALKAAFFFNIGGGGGAWGDITGTLSDQLDLQAELDTLQDNIDNISNNLSSFVPVFVFIGESNSGGYAVNADASAGELAPRSSVQILNNTTLLFESLDVGTNNLIGHTGLPANATHGWEIGLANRIEAGDMLDNEVYLVKCGQGGSIISDWSTAGAYFTTFVTRIEAAKALLKTEGKTPIFYIWYSQGINDAIALTNSDTWKSSTKAFWRNIRDYLGSFAPIICTELPATYTSYNSYLAEIVASESFVYEVDTTGLSLRDTNHWNYSAMKTIAQSMLDVCIDTVGQREDYIQKQSIELYKFIYDSTNSNPNTVGVVSWTSISNASVVSDYLTNSGVIPSGARYINSINANSAFSIVFDLNNLSDVSAIVMYLDTDSNSNYAWDGSHTFLSGMYVNSGGNFFRATSGISAVDTGVTLPAYPAKLKITKSGNDLIFSYSTDAGANYTTIYTDSGILTGQTTLYLKTLFAVAGASKKVKATIV